MNTETRDLVVTRRFYTAVANVWQAWRDPQQVMRWWGPLGFSSPICKMEFREGGTTLVCMRAPDGQDFYNTWTYRKIAPLQKIEFVLTFVDAQGNRVSPVELGLPPDLPQDVRYVITFAALGDNQTEMSVTEYGYTSDFALELSKAGLEQCLDKMGESFKP